ncbi:MAG: aspartate aminotransferase [Candidatus Diapherotrites archaeon]|uniref:Aspartate aminotransferase n=1 Tax=Candidatus Iainarchaeum sp. TaxID=3101447 RepID=A0A2D6LZU6_9ARCH|nr:aspartate aminotransferase [Candidatus Diapherotrites archaeon]|tara:strand:- start:498 stop:1673 length:1176 start_codon:yes stop_codon:yes gene_type:complete
MVELLSERVSRIAPSATFAVKAKANALKAKGVDVLSFGLGEPDFDTPQHIKDAAKKALDEGFTKYTAAAGIPELREGIASKMKEQNSVECSAANIIVSNGAKHSLHNIFQAMLNPGDEVIILSPYWVSYLEQIKLSEGKPIIVDCDEQFQPIPDKIREAITDNTKMIVVNSPNNPTGAVFPKASLKAVADIALENDVYILSDECYENFVYGGAEHHSVASLSPEIAEKTITVNAFSKTFAMTGWRVGYAVAPEPLVKAMSSLQGQTTSNVNSIAQKAVIAALEGSLDDVKNMAKAFDERRKFAVDAFNSIDGVKCNKPEGAFYLFPYVDGLYTEKVKGSSAFCDFLLEEAHVALVPGVAFGLDSCVRFSCASSLESIEKGLKQIKEATKAL